MPKVFLRRRLLRGVAPLVLGSLVASCGSPRADAGRPTATLSENQGAQARFRVLRAAWFSASVGERRGLDPELKQFLERYPDDGASDFVRVFLAVDSASRGALTTARAELAAVRERTGSARDFARVAEAYAQLREGKTDSAWQRLEPLAGKIVDPDERLFYSELRLRVAATEQRYERALEAAEELLAEAPDEARASLRATVREQFRRAPKADLTRALAGFEKDEAEPTSRGEARAFLRATLREQLVSLAVRDKDAVLARSLLDSAPAALRASHDGAALIEIAGGALDVPLVSGRAIGVALSLGSAESRRRSASLAAGLASGLGLPGRATEPSAVQLISGDDAGQSAGTSVALRELAAQGAAILVAGVDDESAMVAARFAETNSIAVVLVTAPTPDHAPGRQAFVLGESRERVSEVVTAELVRRDLTRVVRVGGSSEVGCDLQPDSAGLLRFPVEQWRRERVSAIAVFGSASCASELERELRLGRYLPLLALGLDAAEFVYAAEPKTARFAVAGGHFPEFVRGAEERNSPSPAVDWYQALGHDIAVLARDAFQGFPEGRVEDGRAVRELRERAKRALLGARAELWTSSAHGFSEARVLPRELTIVSAANRASPPTRALAAPRTP